MTVKHYDTDLSGIATLVDLGTTDSAIIGPDAHVAGASLSDTTLVGTGSNQSVTVYGTVQNLMGSAISLGSNSQTNDNIKVGAHGHVLASGTAIADVASDSTIENHGTIRGGIDGIFILGNSTSADTFTVTNTGLIKGGNYGVIVDDSHENVVLTNSGTIKGDGAFFGYYDDGSQTIVNSGKMTGGIAFGQGNDTYNGQLGTATGVIFGAAGNDHITGGNAVEQIEGDWGRDVLTGKGGADHFIFATAADSTVAKAGRDLLTDFSHADGDQIDLHAIDANTALANDQAFKFVGTAAFDGGAGELRYAFANGHTFISGDLDGDKHADFEIELGTHAALAKHDFIL